MYQALFAPIITKVEKELTAVKKRWDYREKDLRNKLVLKETTESSISDDQPAAETEQQMWNIWSSFVAINSSDSGHKKMRFEHFYMLLFFMGLVASPDFDNRSPSPSGPCKFLIFKPVEHACAAGLRMLLCSLGFSDKRMLFSSTDVEVTWDKVYPLKGRAAGQMDFAGFLRFFNFTHRHSAFPSVRFLQTISSSYFWLFSSCLP